MPKRVSTISLLVLLAASLTLLSACTGKSASERNRVVAYCAQDQVYAEPILREFEKTTGIQVRTVYDSEAVKTVGLANRLIAESANPVCDVFWGNEEMRTRQLASRGVFREQNGWAAFGSRSRRIVVNTNLLPLASAPSSLLELTNAIWRGKVALAYPQFGTTATHFHALRQLWGHAAWRQWCVALAANQPVILEGNSSVVKHVGRGEAPLGLTDSDDIAAYQKQGLPVAALPITDQTLFIPNTVGLVRGGPNAQSAQKLFEFLRRPAIASRLVAANALESPVAPDAESPQLRVRWDELLADLEPVTEELKDIFLR